MRIFLALVRSTRAATAVEYGLILALIFLAGVTAMLNVGGSTGVMWNEVADESVKNM